MKNIDHPSLSIKGVPVKVWANTILMVGSPVSLTVRSTMRSQWANIMSTQETNSQWAHCYQCMVSSLSDLTNSSQAAHGVSCKRTEGSQQAPVWAHLVSSLWARRVLNMSLPWVSMWPHSELAVSLNSSLGGGGYIQNRRPLPSLDCN